MRRDSLRVRALIREGADVNAAQGDGMTALHWAAMHGDASQARMLIAAGARLDAVTRNGSYAPLHLAARRGKAAAVAAILESGGDANVATASGGATSLHMASEMGDTAVIRVLLAHKATVDARESAFGQTPLMWAAAGDRVPALRLLLAGGADLKATSKVTDMAAEEKAARAALTLRTRKVAALKAAEQPPRPAGTVTATTPAAATGAAAPTAAAAPRAATAPTAPAASSATAAAPNAASRPAADTVKRTPADSARLAAENRSLSYGELVGKSGGLTPLLFAVRQGHSASVLALLAAGADVNQVSAGDHTSPLLMATINGQFDLAMVLLGKGAKPTLASDAGTTPLYATINVQWAPKSLYPQPTAQLQQETGHLALMEALIKGGADVNARLNKHLWFMSYNFDLLGVNSEGATPFWRAAYGLDIPAMKLLLANGADPKVATKKPAGRLRGDDAPPAEGAAPKDESGLPPIPVGGPGVFPIHAASGVGYGEGYAANSHRHAPDAWIPAVKYLIEVVGADVNARDHNGFTPLHHAAARGDNALIEYLLSKGADIHAVARRGQTVADMANGPVQRIPPFVETVKLLEKLGSKNSNKCKSC
ncbi:MAG: ankyrin repeat domain-containing protein [Gemmatimonadetes bacterium]|nr:ankyrin repeat domain-containing protein [Gemmatimonadota bacterium]